MGYVGVRARGRNRVWGAAGAVLAAVALAGCSGASDGAATVDTKPGGTKTSGSSEHGSPGKRAAAKTAAKGGTVGAEGTACPLPVTFDLAERWKPKPVGIEADSPLAELGTQGPVSMACEIDAKPAGNIGFLRVWTGKPSAGGTPREVLKAFVAAEDGAEKVTYTDVKVNGVPATEAAYTVTSKLLDEKKPEHAFAVSTPKGPVVVHLGGLDSQEHEEMLPAYELAKGSVRVG